MLYLYLHKLYQWELYQQLKLEIVPPPSKEWRWVYLLRQHNSHSIIQDTLSKQEGVQICIHMQLMENSEDCHCMEKKQSKFVIFVFIWQCKK